MFWRILISQARYRWQTTALVFMALVVLVALYVYMGNTNRFANRSMQLIMKRMGHNMVILPRSADPLNFHLCTDDQILFPESEARRVAAEKSLASRYYVAVLQLRETIGGAQVLLTGVDPLPRGDETREKGNMIAELEPGRARLGAAAARALGVAEGEPVSIRGKRFEVARVLPPEGDLDDYRVYVPLNEAQKLLLGEPGKVNALLAFMCLSHGETLEKLEDYQTKTLQRLAPNMRHYSRRDIAEGRFDARKTTESSLGWLLALVLGAAVVVIAATGLQEVWERRKELGIFAAMGTGHSYIVALYLVRMALVAALAAVAGFLIGSLLAVRITTSFLAVQTEPVQILWNDLPRILSLTVLVALAAGLLPMAQLLRLDPNETLTEE